MATKLTKAFEAWRAYDQAAATDTPTQALRLLKDAAGLMEFELGAGDKLRLARMLEMARGMMKHADH
jgi:hypothetical protein